MNCYITGAWSDTLCDISKLSHVRARGETNEKLKWATPNQKYVKVISSWKTQISLYKVKWGKTNPICHEKPKQDITHQTEAKLIKFVIKNSSGITNQNMTKQINPSWKPKKRYYKLKCCKTNYI